MSLRSYRLCAAAILLLAAALRICGAMGDLGQDEITSVTLVGRIDRIDKVFWAINVDNNHPMNSAWLYIVGSKAPFLVMRAFSIALGVGCVAAAGAWGLRRSRFTGLVAMMLFATSYLMVGYGSEARGYSGLILCTILAAMALQDTLDGKDRRLVFGLYAVCGYLFHFDMCLVLVAFGICCFWVSWRRSTSLAAAFNTSLRIFAWPVALLTLAILPVVFGGFSVGSVSPFDLGRFMKAYDLSLECALNLPGLTLPFSDIVLCAVLATAWFIPRQRETWPALYVSSIVALPLLIWAAHVPNTNYPRHEIPCDVAFVLLGADIAGWAWQRGRTSRVVTIAFLVAIMAGNGILLAKFFRIGRGDYSAAVARMTAEGPATYAMASPQLSFMVQYFADRLGATPPVDVPETSWCEKGAPQWLILNRAGKQALPASGIEWGPAGCQAHYEERQVYPSWGLTGVTWILFRQTAAR